MLFRTSYLPQRRRDATLLISLTCGVHCGSLSSRKSRTQIKFQYVLADLWYAAADNLKFIVQTLHKHFVMPLKSNRKVAISQTAQKQGHYVAVDTLALPTGTTREIWLEAVPFALRLTKEVFTNKDGSTGVRYLVTDDF